MEIGFNGMGMGLGDGSRIQERLSEYQDFGAGWIKTSWDIYNAETADGAADHAVVRIEAEAALEYGMRTVVDLRCDPQLLHMRPTENLKAIQTAEKVEWAAASESQRQELMLDRTLRATKMVTDKIGERVYGVVDACKDIIHDWEWWGEHQCPMVSMGSLPNTDYHLTLATVHDACKQADPDCRVWNGGDGVGSTTKWLECLVNPPSPKVGWHMWFPEGVSKYFDCCNWHHYRITLGPGNEDYGLEDVISEYDRIFTEARSLIDTHGDRQPFVSSEWGIAMVDDEVIDALKDSEGRPMLKSYTYAPGWTALPVSRGAEWFQANLECFDRHGFEVLCIHEWNEAEGGVHRNMNFWGAFCGLKDIYGNKRPAYYTVRDWARANYGTAFAE